MQQKTNFARGLSFYKLFWIFTIGCVAGVVLENIWYLLAFHRITNRVGIVLTWTLFAFLVYDILVSAAAVGRMSARHVGKPAANRVEAYLDEQFPDERLHEIYPSMKFVDTTK